jgi:hypothetical protein
MNQYTVMTCQKAKQEIGSAPCYYGYTLVLTTPEERIYHGEDVEGIGWVPFNPPRKVVIRWRGWYKHKSDAEQRAKALNQTA